MSDFEKEKSEIISQLMILSPEIKEMIIKVVEKHKLSLNVKNINLVNLCVLSFTVELLHQLGLSSEEIQSDISALVRRITKELDKPHLLH